MPNSAAQSTSRRVSSEEPQTKTKIEIAKIRPSGKKPAKSKKKSVIVKKVIVIATTDLMT